MSWRAMGANKASFKNWIVNEGKLNEQLLILLQTISGKWVVEVHEAIGGGKGKTLFSKQFLTKSFAEAYAKNWMRKHPNG